MKLSEISAERKYWQEYRAERQAALGVQEAKLDKLRPNGRSHFDDLPEVEDLQRQVNHIAAQVLTVATELDRLDAAEAAERLRIAELEQSLANLRRGLQPGAIDVSAVRLEQPDFDLEAHLAELQDKCASLEKYIANAKAG